MTKSSGTSGLLVGLEIHQQLDTPSKLFCSCPPTKSEELPYRFERRLRPAQSELGRVDPAAVFEFAKGRTNVYLWNPASSCLMEADEEPPHRMSAEALEGTLLVALALRSSLVNEIHVMRKIVIDGSNTSGFQRTAVLGLGGRIEVDGISVGVQSVTVEEDAARILGEDDRTRKFALDRLGVPLVEVALEPVEGNPELVGRVALHLGRVLRSTGRVARGLGTIRQDLNVSLSGGAVVEVKGVQKLNLVPKVVDYERRRQSGLVEIAEKISSLGIRRVDCSSAEVTHILGKTSSRVLKQILGRGGEIRCIAAKGLGGLLGWEPFPGVRLGREVAEVARANGLGGIIHSDEFEQQGITPLEVAALRRKMACSKEDALAIVAGPPLVVARCVPLLVARLEASTKGVPAETRGATEDGETRYMRPRPGSQRMYPETDIPEIKVSRNVVDGLRMLLPENWEAKVRRLVSDYSLSGDLAIKLYDSDVSEQFEKLCHATSLEPSVVASVLVDLPTRLGREGVPEGALTPEILSAALTAVDRGEAAKEAIPDILKEAVAKRLTVSEAISSLGLALVDETHVREVVSQVLARNRKMVAEKRAASFSPLMGEVMKNLRGKADGKMVSRVLKEALQNAMDSLQ